MDALIEEDYIFLERFQQALTPTERIPLRRKDGTLAGYALIDPEDIWVTQWGRWYLGKEGYAQREFKETRARANRKIVRLHQLLMGFPTEVDHKDGDKLNNRRSNLRVVTHGQNRQNLVKTHRKNKSGYRGVWWHKEIKRWQVTIGLNGKTHYVGVYKALDEANAAAVEWRRQHMPFSTT